MIGPRRRAVVFVLAAAAIAGAACKRRRPGGGDAGPPLPPTPVLGPVTVTDLAAEEDRPPHARLDTGPIAEHARRRLAAAGLFARHPPDAGAATVPPLARVRIEFAMEEEAAGARVAARTALRLRIDTRPAGLAADRWNEEVQAAAEINYAAGAAAERTAALGRLVTRTLDDLLDEYVARQRLWLGSAAGVRAALARDGGDLRLQAIRAVAERRLSSEVPALLGLLSDDDETVRDAALGALVEMRERRAVSEIAKSRSMRDRREMRKILDAIGTLGGPEAVDYLAFVGDAHDDPEIRQMAAAALGRLRRIGAAADAGA